MTDDKKRKRGLSHARRVERIEGERGPATLDDTFLAPGRPEFDKQSNFVEIYRANSEMGAGPTEDFFDQYAWVEGGEVARKSAELDYSARGSYHTVMARDAVDNILMFVGINEARASLRHQYIEPGLVVDWDIFYVKALNMLRSGREAQEEEITLLGELRYHMEQEAQNNFHGCEGPPPYEKVHIVAGKRDGFVPTSFCGLSMQPNSDGAPKGHPAEELKQPLWITRARYDRYGMPPFCPPCFECLEAVAHTNKGKEIDGDALVKAQVEGKCICKFMREFTALSTFDKPEHIGPGDPIPAWNCSEHGEVWADEEQHRAYATARTRYEERLTWYKEVALSDRNAPLLDEKSAEEWAAAMVSAELVIQYPREAGRFEATYDDLIGVALAVDAKTGAAASLESEQVDAWTRALPGQENVEARSRILLSLVMDKLLNNPDVEGYVARTSKELRQIAEAMPDPVLAQEVRPGEHLDEVERTRLARLRIEQGVLSKLRKSLETENEFAYEAHWSGPEDVVLLLIDYGRWVDNRAIDEERVLGYVLALVSPSATIAEVIEQGGRFTPALSHRDEPLGKGSADDALALILNGADAFMRPLSVEERKRVEEFAEYVNMEVVEAADLGDRPGDEE